ncbi:MAG: DUF2520 domain-containing protein [Aquamicrobium sp.]|uniref:Rossmann-like and DUF2520 domain-containing protein n=1 Tax=Aquamicrobium sp. TaxID=1872579 RepID=UPI00349ECFFB|nr:DUF2520 domain-containing protein [Aquamicrobium sp.]
MQSRSPQPGGGRPRLNLVGAGSVGVSLFRVFAGSGLFDIQDIYGRDAARLARALSFIGAGRAATSLAAMRPADIWFVTVPDTRIAEVARDLAAAAPAGPATAVHCSGFLPASELAPLSALGWSLASAHPVMTFADPEASARAFPGTYCGMEGDEDAVRRVAAALEAVGARPFTIRPGGKALYHAAAVLSNNLAVVLQALAREAWAEAGVPAEISPDLNAALLSSTARNVNALGPAEALTGPAARGDWSVVERQAKAVETWHPDAGPAYRSLSLLARRLKRTGSTLHPVEEERAGDAKGIV